MWEKIKMGKVEDAWAAENEVTSLCHWRIRLFSNDVIIQEEYEDSIGNVVNKKTYEDLRRQGLL